MCTRTREVYSFGGKKRTDVVSPMYMSGLFVPTRVLVSKSTEMPYFLNNEQKPAGAGDREKRNKQPGVYYPTGTCFLVTFYPPSLSSREKTFLINMILPSYILFFALNSTELSLFLTLFPQLGRLSITN